MIPLLKPIGRTAAVRLAKAGYNLARTERRTRVTGTLYTEPEVQKFADDLDAIYANGTSFGVWPTAASVKDYVNVARINMYHRIVAAVADAGVDLKGKSVLDVGTCTGYLLRIVKDGYANTTLSGTDYYEDCVSLSAALVPDAKVFKASIEDLKTAPDRYDVIFCTEVLEHIVDTESQIPILMDLLNPGGALMLTVPNGRFDVTPAHTSEDGVSWVGHVNFWSPQSWKFYVERVAGQYRYVLGSVGVHYEGDALYAVIFKEPATA